MPILLYIGLLIGAQAFQAVPPRYAVAVVVAIIPNIASWAQGQMADVLSAAGTSAQKVGEANLVNAGVIYKGTQILGGGAILAGLVLGSIVAFIIDRAFTRAAAYCFIGAILSFVGLIHGAQVAWNAGGQVALGYLFFGLVCLGFGWAKTRLPRRRRPGTVRR